MSYEDYGYSVAGVSGSAAEIYAAVVRLLETHVVAGARLLDLGCGNGHFTQSLVNKGFQASGVDKSSTGIAVAKKSHPDVAFVCGTAETMLQSGQPLFDAVVSIEVIEHCPSTSQFCAELVGCLRPGGSVIVTTPYHGYIKNLVIAVLGMHDRHFNPLWDGGHIKFFSVRTLTKALQNAGLRVASARLVGRVPLLAKSMVVHAIKPE